MRTTLTLDEDVAAKVKAEVRRSGRSFKETVNELLRRALTFPRPGKSRFVIRPRNMGGPLPGINLDCASRLLAQLDDEDYRRKQSRD